MKPILTEYVNNSVNKEVPNSYAWYLEPDNSCYLAVNSVLNKIDTDQAYRSLMNIKHARLYSNLELLGLNIYNTAPTRTSSTLETSVVTYNIIKSCIDTAASKIAKNRPKPQFLTSGGDYELQERAKKLTKFIEGVFYNCDYYEVAAKVFIDSCVFGTGFIKFYIENDEIKCERVIPEELKVEDHDGLYSNPKSLYQVKQIARSVLLEQYPEHTFHIMAASSSTPVNSSADLVKCIEAWHLGANGKHVITLENCTLFSEKYTKDHFPFAVYRWSDRLVGYYGQGLAEELVGTQIEINRTLRNIHLAQKLVAIPRVLVESNAGLSTSHLNNEIASIVKYAAGTKEPKFVTATGMNPEVYAHLKWLIQSGYEKTGISQLSATSKKPAGLDSGAALREYSDIETERFMLTALKFEALALSSTKIIISLAKELYASNKNYSVRIPDKDFVDTIAWKEVDLPEDKYVMKLFPVGLLPSTPSGKLQKVQEMLQAGWLSKDQAMSLLDFPDLEQYQSLELANNKLIEKTINVMITSGKYYSPEPQMDLVVAAQLAHKYYLKGRTENLPEEVLELLLRFIDDAERLNKYKNPPQAAPVPPPTPQAQPEAPPVSDLLPFQ